VGQGVPYRVLHLNDVLSFIVHKFIRMGRGLKREVKDSGGNIGNEMNTFSIWNSMHRGVLDTS
jgi:hypothetical protein